MPRKAFCPTVSLPLVVFLGILSHWQSFAFLNSRFPELVVRQQQQQLAAADDTNNDNQHNSSRTRIAGVSVSPVGFWVVLQVAKKASSWVPLLVTHTPEDATAATSMEALTLLQLLAHVDMAGVTFPPDLLSKMVVTECETSYMRTKNSNNKTAKVLPVSEQEERMQQVAKDVEASVRATLRSVKNSGGSAVEHDGNASSLRYTDQPGWIQSRVSLPVCTLDAITVSPPSEAASQYENHQEWQFEWHCSCRHYGTIVLKQPHIIVPHDDDDEAVTPTKNQQWQSGVVRNFLSIALALRYRAPITYVADSDSPVRHYHSESALQQHFPAFRSVQDLQTVSHRSAVAVHEGFEIHKLQSALRIAMQKGDTAAVQQIRAVLDEKDSLNELPVQPDSDIGSMQ